jgi:transcriptional regulator of acetoin/glycerol metabolism
MTYVSQAPQADRSEDAPATPAESARGLSSWQRSLEHFEQYRLDAAAAARPPVLSSAQLREARDKKAALLRAAGECLSRLYTLVCDAGYCVILTDARGIVIDFRADEAQRDALERAGAETGTGEREAQAAGPRSAARAGEPAAFAAREDVPLPEAVHLITCGAAPIFAPNGELVGVLDACAPRSPDDTPSERIVLQLLTQTAEQIENRYFLEQTAKHWVLFGHADRHAVDTLPELLVAIDDGGRVIAGNRRAHRTMATFERVRRIDELFDVSIVRLRDLAHAGGVLALNGRRGSDTLHVRMRAPIAAEPQAVAVVRPGRGGEVPQAPDAMSPFLASCDTRIAENARLALRLAGKRLPILLSGETGVGKEVFARAIHEAGGRKGRPFVAVNCAAIPESLIEGELFGHVPGAFTGARSRGARGKIASADGGTLFLDEIGDMPLEMQTRLLRLLAEGEVVPLGGHAPLRVDLDVICATHRDLERRVTEGRFREDLYYRLSGAPFTIPPLRERADIRELVAAVFDEEASAAARGLMLDPALLERLCAYGWPGNIRQLRNVLRYACAVCESQRVSEAHLSPAFRAQLDMGFSASARMRIKPAVAAGDERARIVQALTEHQWRAGPAAHALGISRATLYRRIASLEIVGPHRAGT